MANIRCEICGNGEIRKSGDDSFVCQGCGIKYSKDDILKLLDVNTEDKREENNEPAESAETENESDKQLEGSILPDETQEECFEENIDEPAAVSTDVKADDANRKNVKRTAIAIIGFVVIAAVIGIICAWAGEDSSASDTIESDVLDYNDSVTFGWDDNDYETADENSTSFSDIIPEPAEYTSIFKKVFPEINSMTKSDENNYYNKNSNSVFIIRDNQIMFVGERYSIIVAYNPDYSDASARIVVHPKNNSATRSQAYGVLCSLLEFVPIDFTPSFEVINENLIHTKNSGLISYYEYSVEKDGKKINYMFEVNGEGEFSIYCDVF